MNPNYGVPWTETETATLREAWARGGVREAVKALPNRTRGAIAERAKKLRLSGRRFRVWTPAEDERLRLEWGSMCVGAVARVMSRTRASVHARAISLGLAVGVPPRCESIYAASLRLGYDRKSLVHILAAAGVETPRFLSREQSNRRYVDADEATEAVTWWLTTENVSAAARARGTGYRGLRAELIRAGLKPPSEARKHWRVPTADIDAAVARLDAAETLRDAAIRHGVSHVTMRNVLRNAGLDRETCNNWRITKADADDAMRAYRTRPRCQVPAQRNAA